ncbi:hypothetical protein M2317_002197 [Microbacterium sp. ZKA21]
MSKQRRKTPPVEPEPVDTSKLARSLVHRGLASIEILEPFERQGFGRLIERSNPR